jgi:hypothetical protein
MVSRLATRTRPQRLLAMRNSDTRVSDTRVDYAELQLTLALFTQCDAAPKPDADPMPNGLNGYLEL